MTTDPTEVAVRIMRADHLFAALNDLLPGEQSGGTNRSHSCGSQMPGVIAMEPGAAIAFAGYSVEYDGSFCLTPPQTIRLRTDASMDAVISHLVRECMLLAARDRCRFIRCLAPDLPVCDTEQQLIQTGFRVAGRISRWSRTTNHMSVAAQAEGVTLTQIELTQLTKGPVIELLRTITAQSSDLTSMPRPDCEALVEFWRDRQMTILAAKTKDELCGLAVVSGSSSTFSQETLTTKADTSEIVETTLEYIGVAPTSRRLGLAGMLMQEVFNSAQAQAIEEETNVTVTAFVDDQNEPAKSFYLKSGFQTETGFRLLVRNIETAESLRYSNRVSAKEMTNS